MRFFIAILFNFLITACTDKPPKSKHPEIGDPKPDCTSFAEVLCLLQKGDGHRHNQFENILQHQDQLQQLDIHQKRDLLRCLQMTPKDLTQSTTESESAPCT